MQTEENKTAAKFVIYCPNYQVVQDLSKDVALHRPVAGRNASCESTPRKVEALRLSA